MQFFNFSGRSINGTTLAFYAVNNLRISNLRRFSTSRPPDLAHHVLCKPDLPTMATPVPLGLPQASIPASDAATWLVSLSCSSSNALFAGASRPPSDDVGASGERARLATLARGCPWTTTFPRPFASVLSEGDRSWSVGRGTMCRRPSRGPDHRRSNHRP